MNDYHHVQLKKSLPSHSGTGEDQTELTTSIKTAVHDDQVLHVNKIIQCNIYTCCIYKKYIYNVACI